MRSDRHNTYISRRLFERGQVYYLNRKINSVRVSGLNSGLSKFVFVNGQVYHWDNWFFGNEYIIGFLEYSYRTSAANRNWLLDEVFNAIAVAISKTKGKFKMHEQFCVKTFNGLLTTRSLTGITRIADHFILNRITMHANYQTLLIKHLRHSDLQALTDYIQNADGIVEIHQDQAENDNEFYGEILGYLISPGSGGERLDLMLHLMRNEAGTVRLNVYCDKAKMSLVDEVSQSITAVVKDKPIQFTLVAGFGSDGNPITSQREIEKDYDLPSDCFYPTITEGIETLFSGFMESNSNLLFMISPPGCGKTTLVRELCRQWKHKNIVQVSGQKTITNPNFDHYISTLSDNTLCIIEDADILVEARNLGNTSMDAFLNELNGIANRNIKFVITTNLENRKHVDAALLRPGRCYSVVELRPLVAAEMLAIVDHLETDGATEKSANARARIANGQGKSKMTLAELLADGGSVVTKVGFELA